MMKADHVIEIMVVDDDPGIQEATAQMVAAMDGISVVEQASNGQEALEKLQARKPDIVLMDINMPVMNGMEATEKIVKAYALPVIIISVQNDPEYIRACMRNGAKDYLFKPFSMDDLEATIRQVYNAEKSIEKKVKQQILEESFIGQPKVLSFVAATGGVGKTTLAVNTGVGLAFAHKKRVALLDLDLLFGDITTALGIDAQRTITDLMVEPEDSDLSVIEKYMVKHESGLYVLPAPRRPEEAELVNNAKLQMMIRTLKTGFDYILLDTGQLSQNENDVFFSVIDMADQTYMVSTRNILVLKNNRLLLDLLTLLGKDAKAIRHILNKSVTKSGLKLKDVQAFLGEDIDVEVSYDESTATAALNQGNPVVGAGKNSRLAKDLLTFAVQLEGENASRHLRRTTMKRLFGG